MNRLSTAFTDFRLPFCRENLVTVRAGAGAMLVVGAVSRDLQFGDQLDASGNLEAAAAVCTSDGVRARIDE